MSDVDLRPLIIAFISDLMLATRFENAARGVGFRVKFIADSAEIGSAESDAPPRQAAEPVFGREATLVDRLSDWQPALMVFDLGHTEIPWRQWIAISKMAPATRRIPIICFGPHIDTALLDEARSRGADAVMPRSRFLSTLPYVLQEYAQVPDYEAINDACLQPPSELAIRGLEAFRQGHYFESHEFLEDAWNEDDSAARDVYKAVLQVAVAYLQIERANYQGAVKMFLRARQWLNPLPDRCRGIDIAQLRADAQAVHQALLDLGPENLADFDRAKLKAPTFTTSD